MSRRLNIELTDMAEQELLRLMDLTNLPMEQLLKHAVTLLRIYVDSREDGKEFRIVKTSDPSDQSRLTMPF